MDDLLNETQVSEKIQVSLACLRRWRLLGEGPEYKKVGPLVRYRPEALEQWLNKQPSGGNGRRFEPAMNGRRPPAGTRPRKHVSSSRMPASIETSSAA